MTVMPSGLLSLAVGPETLLQYDGTDWDVFAVTPSEIHGGSAWTLDMAIAPNGTLWAASWEELLSFDGEAWRRFTVVDGLPGGPINSVAVAPNGDVWVGMAAGSGTDPPGGVGRFDGTSWTVFDETSGLYSNAVMSYLLDGERSAYPTWRNYFDFVLVGGRKPTFFSEIGMRPSNISCSSSWRCLLTSALGSAAKTLISACRQSGWPSRM